MNSNKKSHKNGSKTPDINNYNNKNNNLKNANNKNNKTIFPKIDDNKTNTSFRQKFDISSINNNNNNNINNNNYNNLINNGNINPNYNYLPNIPYTAANYPNGISPNLDFNNDQSSENIKVCVRIRPFSIQEKSRNDIKCIEPASQDQLVFANKNIRRSYTYNLVFGEDSTQEDIF